MSMRLPFSYELLHPKARDSFKLLTHRLEQGYRGGSTPTLFKPFEGYRDPQQQLVHLKNGTSKAGPWQSAHNYGLAVDYVPLSDPMSISSWSWGAGHDWDFLREAATNCGLFNTITWDRPHVQHPIWLAIASKVT